MHKPPTKQDIVASSRQYYKRLVTQIKQNPFLLNINLTSNPFLKDKDAYKFLKFQLAQYNKRVQKKQIKDAYQMLSYQRLHSMLSDLSQIDTRQDQIIALQNLNQWFKQQYRLVQQRNDQGNIRYQMSKQYREFLNLPIENKNEEDQEDLNIPFYMIEKIIQPYRRHSRTIHSQFQNPQKRLNQYKRKTINIATFAENKEQIKPQRVLYPVPPKYQPPKEEQNQQKPPLPEGQQPPPVQGEQQPPKEGQLLPEVPLENEQPGVPDMGGFGQQPQQPQEQQPPEDAPDKLKPKNPLYVDAISVDNQKKYKQAFMFYLGNENKQQRNMELRYIRKYHDNIRKQKQDSRNIQIANQWAKKKSKIEKDMQIKLEQMKFKPNYSYSKEPAIPQQRINIQDEIKFGFTSVVKAKSKSSAFQMTYNQLPKIANQTFDQKSIRKQRLNSLKNKFSKILNIAEYQDRQTVPSLCQFTARRRGLSQIIRNHSHSKQRLHQLQQVSKIKEKLAKVKINLNIKALARGLCLPESQDYFVETQRQFPNKQLPSNPNMVQTKKKKKKK